MLTVRRLVCFFLALTCLLSGCTLADRTRPVVKIGLVAPFEGLHRSLGYDTLYAVKLAVRQYNADVTGGPMVELVALDDTQDPDHAVEQARELTLDPDVVGVVGHVSAATTAAALPEYLRAGLSLVIPVAVPEAFRSLALRDVAETSSDATAQVMASAAEVEGAVAARFAVEVLGAKRVVAIGGAEAVLSQAFVGEAEALGAVVHRAVWPGEGLIQVLAQDMPEAIFFAGGPVAGAEFLVWAHNMGLTVPVIGASSWEDQVLAHLAGDTVRQAYFLVVTSDLEGTPAGQRFQEDYMAYAGHRPSSQAALVYDATGLLLQAIWGASGSGKAPNRAVVARRLSGIRLYVGAAGEYRFNAMGQRVQGPAPTVVAVTAPVTIHLDPSELYSDGTSLRQAQGMLVVCDCSPTKARAWSATPAIR